MKKAALFAVALICIQGAYAQAIFNKIKNKVAQAASKTIDAPSAKREAKSDGAKSEPKASEERPVNEPTPSQEATAAAPAPQKLASHTRYDFVPGQKVLLWEDFEQDAIGEFPLKWFTRSKGETVTISASPGKWLRMYPGGFLSPTVDMKENYTVEFDLVMDFPLQGGYLVPSFGLNFYDRGSKNYVFSYDYRLENHMSIAVAPYRSEAHVTFSSRENGKPKFDSDKMKISAFDKKVGKPIHVAVTVQKERIRVWLDEEKVFDLPAAAPYPGNINQLQVFMNTSNYSNDQIGYYVSNFKIAAGDADIRSKFLAEGKITTTGIMFDVNEDKIKNESYGTINEIAKLLKENPGTKVKIVGHTDATGNSAGNLTLSKKRADAVARVLVSEYGLAEDDIETDGKGSSVPAGDNKTAEGRAMNRRVEFIKK